MAHLALVGDSVFDNGAYTAGGPAVVSQVKRHMPLGWRVTLGAVDGARIDAVATQLARLPADVERLAVSVGGNDVLGHVALLDAPVRKGSDAVGMIGEAARAFEAAYREMIAACLHVDRHAIICTVYSGNFPDPVFQRLARTALTPFNDAIIRTGVEFGLTVIDLRLVCDDPEDFVNAIEPSSVGGDKIAKALVRAATGDGGWERSARIIG
ncbi:MAG: GDSL-type esterase/lipase family protein [Methylocystis sp.]|uniref:GDSL-type esterase/lipase family protein n=1 Tax=Methylocystis sp. TaxID=1911079 RepID=UPI003DA5F18A